VSWYGAAREDFRAALQSTAVDFRLLPALPPQGEARGERRHAVDFYLRQAGFDAPQAAPIAPFLPFRRQVDGPARRFIAIHPFSGSHKKNWDLASFRTAASHLREASGLRVEWCAGPEEQLTGARRFEALDEVANWLCGASVYIGNDSGISHLAAACGIPVVVIFTVTDAAIWSPRGAHVAVLQSPDVQEVVGTALSLLSATARA
jgi:ADP-heptose:LPS heptosyltransferase